MRSRIEAGSNLTIESEAAECKLPRSLHNINISDHPLGVSYTLQLTYNPFPDVGAEVLDVLLWLRVEGLGHGRNHCCCEVKEIVGPDFPSN